MFQKKLIIPGFIGILLSFLVFSLAHAASGDYLNLADSSKDQQLAAVLDGLKKQIDFLQATIRNFLLAGVGVSNQPPVFTQPPPPTFTVTEGDAPDRADGRNAFNLLARDPEGKAVTFSASSLPEGARLIPGSPFRGDSAAMFRWAPDYTQAGVYDIAFTAKDPGGWSVTATSSITVVDVPSGPPLIIRPLGAKAAKVGRALNVIVSASDPEGGVLRFSFGTTTPPDGVGFLPYGDVSMNGQRTGYDAALLLQHLAGKLSLSAEQKVLAEVTGDGKLTKEDAKWIQEATVSLRQLTGNKRVVNWIPKAQQVGTHIITVVVTDPDNFSDVESIKIVVSK